jgi:hypothetical protein
MEGKDLIDGENSHCCSKEGSQFDDAFIKKALLDQRPRSKDRKKNTSTKGIAIHTCMNPGKNARSQDRQFMSLDQWQNQVVKMVKSKAGKSLKTQSVRPQGIEEHV